MTRQPDADERFIVPVRGGPTEERVYLRDLAKYLHHNGGAIRRFGKKRALLHRVRCGNGRAAEEYFSPYGALRVIAYIRALQGEGYRRGRPFHEQREQGAAYMREYMRKQRERLNAAAVPVSEAACIPDGRDRR
jgi:hypothetical protein